MSDQFHNDSNNGANGNQSQTPSPVSYIRARGTSWSMTLSQASPFNVILMGEGNATFNLYPNNGREGSWMQVEAPLVRMNGAEVQAADDSGFTMRPAFQQRQQQDGTEIGATFRFPQANMEGMMGNSTDSVHPRLLRGLGREQDVGAGHGPFPESRGTPNPTISSSTPAQASANDDEVFAFSAPENFIGFCNSMNPFANASHSLQFLVKLVLYFLYALFTLFIAFLFMLLFPDQLEI